MNIAMNKDVIRMLNSLTIAGTNENEEENETMIWLSDEKTRTNLLSGNSDNSVEYYGKKRGKDEDDVDEWDDEDDDFDEDDEDWDDEDWDDEEDEDWDIEDEDWDDEDDDWEDEDDN